MCSQSLIDILMCHRTQDNRLFTIALPKGQPGEVWLRLFRGDSDGARHMQPPYQLAGLFVASSMNFMCPCLP